MVKQWGVEEETEYFHTILTFLFMKICLGDKKVIARGKKRHSHHLPLRDFEYAAQKNRTLAFLYKKRNLSSMTVHCAQSNNYITFTLKNCDDIPLSFSYTFLCNKKVYCAR